MKSYLTRNYVYLFIISFPIILFLKPLLQGNVLFWGASSLQFIPWRSLAMESLASGQMPFWNPYNGLGTPLLANYQLGFFYPPNWIQLIFYLIWETPGIALSYNFLVPIHLIWSAIGVVFFTRELKCGSFAQAVSAISFSLSTYLVARTSFFSILWTVSWLPWIMYLATRMLEQGITDSNSLRKKWDPFLKLSLVIAMILLAGHAQSAWYILLITGSWVVYKGLLKKKVNYFLRTSTTFLLAGLTAIGIAAIQLIPTFEFLQQSQRGNSLAYEYVVRYSFWPWHLLTFILPDFFGNPGNGSFWGYGNYWEDACYIGLIPLFFVLYAIFRALHKSRLENSRRSTVFFFGMVSVIAGLIALGNNTPLFSFLYHWIPSFNMFQAPSRWMILSIFSLSIISALGVDEWLTTENPGKKRYYLIMVFSGGVILAGILSKILIPGLPTTMTSSLIRFGIIGLIAITLLYLLKTFKDQKRNNYLSACILILIGVDLLTVGFILNPFTNSSLYRSSIQLMQNPISEKRSIISSADEYDLKFQRFFRTHDFRAIESWDSLRLVNLPNINILSGKSYINNFDPMVSGTYQKLVEIFENSNNSTNVQWLRHMNVDKIEQIDIQNPSGIEFRPVADSRFYHSYSCQKPQMIKKTTLKPNEFFERPDPDSPLFINTDDRTVTAETCVLNSFVKVSESNGTNNSLLMKIDAEKQSWLEISLIFYPGWKATLDGKPIELLGVNGIFLGANIPMGVHYLSLEYKPDSYYAGLSVTAIFLVVLIGLILFIFFSNQHDSKD
jgi:hypothetical protein